MNDNRNWEQRLARARWVALSQISGLGSRTIDHLIERIGSLPAVFTAPESELRAVPRVGPKTAAAIRQVDLAAIAQDIEAWESQGVRLLLRHDADYPPRFLALEEAPVVLFARGQPGIIQAASIALVGTRQPSEASLRLAAAIAGRLAHEGFSIISGLAAGIDEAAHKAALEANGHTVAVLGSGVLAPYPPQNRSLAGAIAQSGWLLSEVRADSPPSGPALVARNRLISGLAQAVIVVETGVTGGSLHTVRFAQRQGKPVFAVDNGTPGSRHLLENGARALPVDGWYSILCDRLGMNNS